MRAIPANQLDQKMTTVWRIGGLINTVIIAVIVIAVLAALNFGFDQGGPFRIIGALIVIVWFAGDVLLIPAIRYRRWRFDVTEQEVDIDKGIIIRQRIIIPLVRVQFTDTRQGPIMRACGLAEVTINTAGGEKTIPGLSTADADALRDKVARLASLAREEV